MTDSIDDLTYRQTRELIDRQAAEIERLKELLSEIRGDGRIRLPPGVMEDIDAFLARQPAPPDAPRPESVKSAVDSRP